MKRSAMITQSLFRRLLAVLCLAGVLAGAGPLRPAGAAAQELPPVNLHVYIDRSRSVYDPDNEKSPHKAILEMIKALADQPTGSSRPLIRQGSTITAVSFGDQIGPEQSIAVGTNRDELVRSIDRLGDLGKSATTTDFAPVFRDILAKMANWSSVEQGLQVVLIASDFVQEELPGLRTKPRRIQPPGTEKAEACDYLTFTAGAHVDRIATPLDELGAAIDRWNRARRLPIVFIGLRVAPGPDYLRRLKGEYGKCFARAIERQWVFDRMKAPMALNPLDYNSISTQLPDLVRQLTEIVNNASGPGLAIDTNASRCLRDSGRGTLDCTVKVGNRGKEDRVIEKVGFSLKDNGANAVDRSLDKPIVSALGSRTLDGIRLEGADAQPFMKTNQLRIGLTADRLLRSGFVPIDIKDDRALELTGPVQASRPSPDSNYTVTLTVRNPVDKKRKPDAVFLSEQPNGGALIGRTAVPPGQPYLVAGDKPARIESLELSREASEALDNGRARYMILQSSDEESGTAESQPVEITPERYDAVILSSATATSGNGEDWDLKINARSPDQSGRIVEKVVFTEDGGRKELTRQVPPETVTLPQAGKSFALKATPDLAQTLSEGRPVQVAIFDKKSGKTSAPIAVNRERPSSSLLVPVSASVDAATADRLTIRIRARNVSRYGARLTALRFFPSNPGAAPVTVALAAPLDLAPSGSDPVDQERTVDINRKDLGALTDHPVLGMRLLDRDGIESQTQINVGNLPGKPHLRVVEARFDAGEANAIAIVGRVHNPSVTPTTITGIRPIANGSPLSDAVLMLQPQVTVDGGAERPFEVALPPQLMAKFPPAVSGTAMLIEQEQGAEGGPPAPAFQIAPLRQISLTVERGSIADGKMVLALRNGAKHTLHLTDVWLAASALDVDRAAVARRTPPEPIPPGQQQVVSVPLTDQQNAILKSRGARPETVWVCARTELEPALAAAGNSCAAGAVAIVKVPQPKPLAVVMNPDPTRHLEGNQRRIRLTLVNRGEVANEASAVEIWGQEGDTAPSFLGSVGLERPLVVPPGSGRTEAGKTENGELATTNGIADDLFRKAYGYEKLWICPVDETRMSDALPKFRRDGCDRLQIDSLIIKPIETQIQNVRIGDPLYTVIVSKVRVERKWDFPLSRGLAFTAHLKPSPAGDDKPIEVSLPNGMSGTAKEVELAWRLPYGVDVSKPLLQFSPASFPIVDKEREHFLPADPIDIVVNVRTSLALSVALLIACFGVNWAFRRKIPSINPISLMQKIRSLPNLVSEGKSWVGMFTYLLPAMSVPVFGAAGIWGGAGGGFFPYNAVLGTLFWAFVLLFVFIFILWVLHWGLVTWPAARHARAGGDLRPYPLFFRFRFVWRFVPALVATFVAIMFLGYYSDHMLRPYNPKETPFRYIEDEGQAVAGSPVRMTSTQIAGGRQ